jgi:hypothetical protein
MQENKTILYTNAIMDTYHGCHGKGSCFEYGGGLSIPLVWLLSTVGVPDYGTFFHHTLFVAGFVSISFLSNSRDFLCWILSFALLWLCTLISLRSRSRSTNLMRASSDGVVSLSVSFSDFLRLNVLTWEHCSTFSRKADFSDCPLMLS